MLTQKPPQLGRPEDALCSEPSQSSAFVSIFYHTPREGKLWMERCTRRHLNWLRGLWNIQFQAAFMIRAADAFVIVQRPALSDCVHAQTSRQTAYYAPVLNERAVSRRRLTNRPGRMKPDRVVRSGLLLTLLQEQGPLRTRVFAEKGDCLCRWKSSLFSKYQRENPCVQQRRAANAI